MLVLGLGYLARGTRFTKARCCLFEKFYRSPKHEPRQPHCMKSHKKLLEWTCTLNGAGSEGYTRVGPTVLARFMETQICTLLPALWQEGPEKNNGFC